MGNRNHNSVAVVTFNANETMDLRNWSQLLNWKAEEQTILQYAVTTLIAAAILGGIFGILNLPVAVVNVRALLTTLAVTKASVLAIVFSVTVVALQLVVRRYSARLTSLFMEDPVFRATFGLFVGAIGFDLLMVYLLPAQSNQISNAAAGVAFGLAGAATIALYRFILLVIQRSSPDELIDALVERELRPVRYLPTDPENLRTVTVHPLRPLYSTTSRAIELAEYRTAKQGIEAFQTVLNDTFAHLRANYNIDKAHEFSEAVSKEILTEYFPSVIEQSFNHEQHGLVSDATETVERITVNALHQGYPKVAEHAADGLGDAFNEAPMTWEGNRLRRPVTETLVRITELTASTADYATFSMVFHNLHNAFSVHLRRRPDNKVTRRLVNDYYGRHSVSIFEELVDRYAPQLRDAEVDWISPRDGATSTLPSEARALRHFWRNRTSFMQGIFHYRVSQEEYPFVEGNIDDGWRQSVEKAADAELDGLAVLFCITMIQVTYRVEQLEGKQLGLWRNTLAHLRIDYGPDIVDTAFELLEEGVQPESSQIRVHSIAYDPSEPEQGILERLFSGSETDEEEFEEWLPKFEEQVRERIEYIRES